MDISAFRHRPAMCISLPMNALCCASVLPSTHDYAYRACDTSTTASRIAPACPKMLSIALVLYVYIHDLYIRVSVRHTTRVAFRGGAQGGIRPPLCSLLPPQIFFACAHSKCQAPPKYFLLSFCPPIIHFLNATLTTLYLFHRSAA